MKTKILSVIAAASLAVTSFAALTITASARDLTNVTGQVTAMNGETFTGTIHYNCWLVIPAGFNVTLSNLTIDGSSWQGTKWAAIHITNGSNGDSSTITLEGTNTIRGFNPYYPGIYVSEGKTLYIEGSGTLNVSSNGYAPGIGSAFDYDNDEPINCGNIVINSGTINATGGEYAAGIGTGTSSSCGSITINGGTVTATGGEFAAGIGSGAGSSCGNITVTGGTVNATGGAAAPGIGSGVTGSCGSITITDDVTSVTATKGNDYDGYNALYSIGAGSEVDELYGAESTVGTVTIGGVVGAKSGDTFVYAPVHATPASATYAQVGEDYTSQTAENNTASLWRVTVTPGDTAITSLSVEVNGKTPDAPLSDTTKFSGGGDVSFGVVLNRGAADVTSFVALVNGEAVDTTLE